MEILKVTDPSGKEHNIPKADGDYFRTLKGWKVHEEKTKTPKKDK